ncbi:hypothetical protein J7384_16800 [Endozoicomonas sp. G2_1]|uniref:hypothetical protein n=1 Tax=Endozoicomonas sp. G2_1 TaxID=2821091 RepID=UPI001AD9D418|nr:hypothetical protein [Endozoicomonas sp. G2_1]MBO9492022.1 hypothetical protein [Endozoicomonas sp. G2_1]
MNNNRYVDLLDRINLDELHIRQAFDYYRNRFQKSEVAQGLVESCCAIDDALRENTMIGFCDRTMGRNIPRAKTAEGAAIRGSLQRVGLIKATGHELFRGCVVFPTYNDDGTVISAVGYRIGRVRSGDKPVVYWCRPESKGFVDAGMSFAKELVHGQAYH